MPVTISVAITPDYGKAGSNYAFTVTAVDRNVLEVEETVPYVVEHVNRAPVAIEEEKTVELTESGMSEIVSFAEMFDDPDGDGLSYTLAYSGTAKATSAYTTPTGVIFYGEAIGQDEAIVTATDESGATAQCRLKLIVKELSGVDNINGVDGGVTVMPNPVVADINAICGFTADEVTFTVYDCSGRAVCSDKAPVAAGEAHVIPFSSVPAGVYFLNVSAQGVNTTVTVLKK